MKFSHRAIIYPNKNNDSILRNLTNIVNQATKPLEIQIAEYKAKGSQAQLRTWWRLITELTLFFNNTGNRFTKEQVSDYFKIKAGFCVELDGQKLPRSLAKKSDARMEEVSNLLETLLEFGTENNIELDINSKEKQEFIQYYGL